MILLNLSKVQKSFGTDVLFSDVSFHIGEKDKIGFVGANGAGKTTLFKIMLRKMAADSGDIFQNKLTNIGYMEQQTNLTSDRTVYGELMTVFGHLKNLERELAEVAEQIAGQNGDLLALADRQHRLQETYEREGGFTYQSVAKASLLGLGFSEKELSMPFDSLSGGQKTRVFLCKILLSQANLLFLDEPTNHLDIQSVEWLENFLRDYNGAFVVISHDRYFLDRVSNRIFELENQRLTVYDGNYSTYVKLKEERRQAQERQYENTQREIQRIEGIIEQQRRWNREKNIKTAESKQKQVDRLAATLDKPLEAPDGIRFSFTMNRGGGNDVLVCDGLSMRFGEKRLFEGLNLHVIKGERVFLLGPNGCGKTTLFKLVTGEHVPKGGTLKLGANIDIGYYDQTQDHLDYSKTVFGEVADSYPKLTQTEIRNALAAFLFRGDDVFKEIASLSGGERAKVTLLKLMISGANFLLLDEPTNHLDISSREMLEKALLGYEGTLLVVSHDRYFVNKLASRVCYMTGNGLENYLGNYDYFLEKHKLPQTEQKEEKCSGKNDYRRKKQMEAEERKRKNRLKKTEEEIAKTEEQIEACKAQLALPECATDYIRAAELTEKLDGMNETLLSLYAEWEELCL